MSTDQSVDPYQRPSCLACGQQPGRRAYVLSRLVSKMQRAFYSHEGRPEWGWVSDVLDDEGLQEFCGKDCWTAAEPDVREAWGLSRTFNGYVPTTDCARCGKEVDRRLRHVVLALGDEEFVDDHQVQTHEAWDYAVLCLDCGGEGARESASESEPAVTESELSVVADRRATQLPRHSGRCGTRSCVGAGSVRRDSNPGALETLPEIADVCAGGLGALFGLRPSATIEGG